MISVAEYYAVERSPEYLAHYGVKGMRWGVRKAKESGSDKKLWRQYSKAHKKLNKLSRNADVSVQRRNEIDYEGNAKSYRKLGRAGLGLALSGTGSSHLINHVLKRNAELRNIKRINEAKDNYEAWKEVLNSPNYAGSDMSYADQMGRARGELTGIRNTSNAIRDNEIRNLSKADQISNIVRNAGIGMAIGGYGGYGINKIKAHNARKRQTVKGNKEAIKKRDAWQREMNKAFKGTKYANSLNPNDYGKEYYKRYKSRLDKKMARLDAYDKKTNYRRFRQKYD